MVQRLSSRCDIPQERTLTAFSLFPSEDVLETSSEDEDTQPASSFTLLPPGLDHTPTARSTAGRESREAPGRATARVREATARGHCRLQGSLGAGPYGIAWALANSTLCLAIATARYSYIDSYIDSFIDENDIVETMILVGHNKLAWPSLAAAPISPPGSSWLPSELYYRTELDFGALPAQSRKTKKDCAYSVDWGTTQRKTSKVTRFLNHPSALLFITSTDESYIMPLVRDPRTGLVSITTVDPDNNSWLNDPKYGKVRRAFTRFTDEEDQEKLDHVAVQRPLQSTPSKLDLGLEDPLVIEDTTSKTSPEAECANSRYRPGMWVQLIIDEDLDAMVDPRRPFLNRLGHFCLQAQIRYCRREKCRKTREIMDRVVPRCEWARFREWALILTSCQASCTPEQRLLRPHFHLSAAAKICHWLLYQYKDERKKMTKVLLDKDGEELIVDLFGVCEIIYWMQTAQHHLTGFSGVFEGRWSPEFLQPSITAPAVKQATREAHKLGLCQNRFWNLALISERKYMDLPGLMETAVKHPQLRHKDHDKCTAGFCRFTSLDSTTVTQLHKCEDTDKCKNILEFDPELLNQSLKGKGRTVWTISDPFEVSQDSRTPYMAVSHVWSDGTGIGAQAPGKVNKCLFEYMANITKRVGCEAIWWDTISIPTDETARREAINQMHMNYSRAKCTVVHDQYLLDYQWADDGSPCVALVFSPWLTRGWTALELIMSKTVKVLFKGPNDLEPVIKDLDQNILADDPSRCSRAHWIASTIIRRLRQPIRNTTDLMAVLKPRSTSWPRDRMIIAGLLAGFEFKDYKISQEEITKAVINRVVRIYPSSLHHGQVTITESGGWSWCPPSLYDMPVDTAADLLTEGAVGDKACLVDKHGVIAGDWYYRPLEEREVKEGRIVANSTQMPVVLKIKDALRRWRYCMLLRETNDGGQGTGLLVMPVGGDGDFFLCKFVGSVQEFSPRPPKGYDERYRSYWFKIGYEGKPELEAKFYVRAATPLPEQIRDYHWLHGKLWIGDKPFSGQILVARFEPETGLTKGHYLEATANDSSAQKPTSAMDGDPSISVFLCNAKVGLSEKSVFRARNGRRSEDKVLTRIAAAELWPPSTIPAKDRTHHTWEPYDTDSGDYSKELFRLESPRSGPHIFAAIDPMLHTPDARHPYKGVWIRTELPSLSYPSSHGLLTTPISTIGLFPGHGYEFLLFHQPSDTRLEAIKLTGDRDIPRGAHSFIVEDLKDVKRTCMEEKWLDSPVVAAKVQMAGDGFVNRMFPTL